MDSKLASKWSKIIGAAVGAVGGGAAATLIVGTSSIGLLIVAGCALATGVAGATLGDFIGKRLGVGTAIAAGVLEKEIKLTGGIEHIVGGMVVLTADDILKKTTGKGVNQHMNSAGVVAGITIAAALSGGKSLPIMLAGAIAGGTVDVAVKQLTKQTIGELGKNATKAVSTALKEVSEQCRTDPAVKAWLEEQTISKKESNKKIQQFREDSKLQSCTSTQLALPKNYGQERGVLVENQKIEQTTCPPQYSPENPVLPQTVLVQAPVEEQAPRMRVLPRAAPWHNILLAGPNKPAQTFLEIKSEPTYEKK